MERSIGKSAAEWGKLGEKLTCEYLSSRGLAITETNWRCGNRLEVDIISEQGDEMVFIEVKTRNGRHNNPEEAIDTKKIKQLVKAADAYLSGQQRDYSARFDVAFIEGSPTDYDFTYIENAFIPPLEIR